MHAAVAKLLMFMPDFVNVRCRCWVYLPVQGQVTYEAKQMTETHQTLSQLTSSSGSVDQKEREKKRERERKSCQQCKCCFFVFDYLCCIRNKTFSKNKVHLKVGYLEPNATSCL